jgi:hypothetical protein
MTEPAEEDKQREEKHQRIRTIYSNVVRIGHSPYEFMLDFGQFQPEGKRAFMDVRIITSPPHARAILKALEDNIARYEEKYGRIGVKSDSDEEDRDTDRRRRRM